MIDWGLLRVHSFHKLKRSLLGYGDNGYYAVKNRAYFPVFGEKVGYIGWLGHGNMGDEAMYQAVSRALRSIRVLPYKTLRGVQKIERICGRRIYRMVLLGGGTLINESTYFDLFREAQDLGYPTAVFGAGVRNPEFWDTVSKDLNHLVDWIPLLERSRSVGVRGPISKMVLENYGFPNAVITGDPALLWARSNITTKQKKKRLGINIGISPEKIWGTTENVLAFTVKFARIMIEKGWHITFVPVSSTDLPYIEDAVRQLGRQVEVLKNYKSVKNILKCIETCDIFVGEKLHSVVLACCTYTPSIMLEYRPKCRDFMASLAMERYNIRTDALDLEHLLSLCNEVYERSRAVQELLFDRVSDYRSRLMQQIELIR